jgi:hypothetical protein
VARVAPVVADHAYSYASQVASWGRLEALSGRAEVEAMHPELEGRAVLVSGHHGWLSLEGDRLICDSSGGYAHKPLEAIIFSPDATRWIVRIASHRLASPHRNATHATTRAINHACPRERHHLHLPVCLQQLRVCLRAAFVRSAGKGENTRARITHNCE